MFSYHEILKKTGFIDSCIQSSIFLLMAISEKKVSEVAIGRITPYSFIYFLKKLNYIIIN